MKVNYLVICIASFILAFVYNIIVDMRYSRMNKEKKFSSVDFKSAFLVSLAAPIVCCFLFSVFSSTVYIIKPNKEYSKEQYVLFYKGIQGKSHIVVPFTHYLSNESNRNVIIYSVGYGGAKYETYPTYHYGKNEFTRIEEEPYYYFEEAPNKVWSHGNSARRNILDYND